MSAESAHLSIFGAETETEAEFRSTSSIFHCFCAVEHVFLPARRYASEGNSDRTVSVRLSVCHEPVLCQNEES